MSNKYIDIHTHSTTDNQNIILLRSISVNEYSPELLNSFKYASIGVHPWHLKSDWKQDIEILEKNIHYKNIIAIGESGLDREIETSIDEQEITFIEQIKLAEKYKKPIILHCVRAYYDIVADRKRLKAKMPWVFHKYHARVKSTEPLLNHNFYFSFGEDLFKNDKHLLNTVKMLPVDRIFLETDESEYKIEEVYEKMAEIKEISIQNLKQEIQNNFQNCFNIQL